MTTIYMSGSDFRNEMQRPDGAPRCHAICRRLLGTAKCYPSAWYGAHYYVACALTDRFRTEAEGLEFWKRSMAREVSQACDDVLPAKYEGLWQLAVRRVREVLDEAKSLPTSVMW